MKKIIFALILTANVLYMQAQKETNIWHFGINSGLNFNDLVATVTANDCWWNGSSYSYTYGLSIPNVPKVITGFVNTVEGCFTISDNDNGNFLLSSDGSWLYNRNGVKMNTISLGGDPSATQSGIVIPRPGHSNRYYAISVNAVRAGKLQYAEVDMTLNAGLGGIISQNNNLTTFNTDENISAIPHSNGTDYWLLHRTGNLYHTWLIESNGFTYKGSTPTSSTSLPSTYDFIGELIISPDGTKIVALTFDRNEILSANFDPSTGIISNTQHRKLANDPTHGFYGGCFSPNGEYLYYSFTQLTGNTYDAFCISWTDLRSGGNPNRMVPLSNIHRGPDGRLYGIRLNSPMLLIVTDPNAGDLHTKYITTYFSNLQLPQIGLPTFLYSHFGSKFGIYPLACRQNAREIAIEITSGGASPATTIDWDFGDGTVVTGQPITPDATKVYTQLHTYAAAGTKTITITPRAADGTVKPTKTFQIEVIPCAIKTNRMIRTDLKDSGEP